jgi:hypothetical protein
MASAIRQLSQTESGRKRSQDRHVNLHSINILPRQNAHISADADAELQYRFPSSRVRHVVITEREEIVLFLTQ